MRHSALLSFALATSLLAMAVHGGGAEAEAEPEVTPELMMVQAALITPIQAFVHAIEDVQETITEAQETERELRYEENRLLQAAELERERREQREREEHEAWHAEQERIAHEEQHRQQEQARQASASVSGNSVWDRLAQCESGGNWSINTGNGYYGGLQFNLQTWQAYGGTGYPHQHSRATQISVAQRLHAARGFQPWPACSRKLGLR